MEMSADYEWAAQQHREVDVLKSAQASNLLVGKVMTINEDRELRGLVPLPQEEANVPGVFSPMNGFIPIEGSIDAATAQRAAALASATSRSDASGEPDDGKAQDGKKKRVNTKPNGKGDAFTDAEKEQAKKAMLANRANGGYSAFGSLRQ